MTEAFTHRPRGSAKALFDTLKHYQRILITGHTRPDGDATGSCIAMARLLKANGWKPTVALSSIGMGPPKFLLDYADCIVPTKVRAKDYDCAFVLDCSGLNRIPEGPLREAVAKLPIVNLDHHVTSVPFGIARWVVPDASSTGELVYRFAKRWKWTFDKETAEALWVALITDTGRFSYSCTHTSTMKAGAELLACGVDSSSINDRIYLYASEGALYLRRRAYDSLQTWFRGKVSLISLTAGNFKTAGVPKSEVEDVIDIPRSVPTAKVSLFFYETSDKPNVTRLSIRTREENAYFSAVSIAHHFGGGGHLRAAGCDIPVRLSRALPLVKDYLASLFEAQKPSATVAE
ncbi:MAG: bifunctional oligoribonuclease/PAP phosphatase NrnA [Kiritimatiellia bacterium]